MYFQDTQLLPGQTATKGLHVVTVFNFPGAKGNEKKRKYQTNSAQESYNLCKNSLKLLTVVIAKLVYERSGVQLSKENCERRVELYIRKIEIVPFGEQRKDENVHSPLVF